MRASGHVRSARTSGRNGRYLSKGICFGVTGSGGIAGPLSVVLWLGWVGRVGGIGREGWFRATKNPLPRQEVVRASAEWGRSPTSEGGGRQGVAGRKSGVEGKR